MFNKKSLVIIMFICSFLFACGDGGGGSSSTPIGPSYIYKVNIYQNGALKKSFKAPTETYNGIEATFDEDFKVTKIDKPMDTDNTRKEKYEYTYNTLGKKIQQKYYKSELNPAIADNYWSYKTFEYNEAGQIIKVQRFNTSHTLIMGWYYTYNSNGDITRIYKTKLLSDPDGTIVFNGWTFSEVPYEEEVFAYNSDNILLYSIWKHYNASLANLNYVTQKIKTTFTFDSKYRCIQKDYQEVAYDVEFGAITKTEYFSYNEKDYVEEVESESGSTTTITTYEYLEKEGEGNQTWWEDYLAEDNKLVY